MTQKNIICRIATSFQLSQNLPIFWAILSIQPTNNHHTQNRCLFSQNILKEGTEVLQITLYVIKRATWAPKNAFTSSKLSTVNKKATKSEPEIASSSHIRKTNSGFSLLAYATAKREAELQKLQSLLSLIMWCGEKLSLFNFQNI